MLQASLITPGHSIETGRWSRISLSCLLEETRSSQSNTGMTEEMPGHTSEVIPKLSSGRLNFGTTLTLAVVRMKAQPRRIPRRRETHHQSFSCRMDWATCMWSAMASSLAWQRQETCLQLPASRWVEFCYMFLLDFSYSKFHFFIRRFFKFCIVCDSTTHIDVHLSFSISPSSLLLSLLETI